MNQREKIDSVATAVDLPPKPEEPVPGECCGRGCVNCVWVYYELALERWKQRCAEIKLGEAGSGE